MVHLSLIAVVLAAVGAVLASLLGGAIGGLIIGRKDLGTEVAAMMGAFLGPIAGLGGVALGAGVVWMFAS
jgi:hypothetical protein